jgi:hypothetical protein
MALFFIVFQAVLVPAVYAVLWLLNWQKAIELAHTRDLTPGWISLVATLGSLAVSTFRYYQKPQQSDTAASRMIIPGGR